MVSREIKYTVKDYMSLPESDEKRYELIDGELCMVPSPTPTHQDILGNLFEGLRHFVRRRDLGRVFVAPLDVVLSDTDVLQPDLLFVSRSREGIITDRNIQGPPDLVVEILSPGTSSRDRNIKRTRYAKFGVREYWLVDPENRTVEVLRASEPEFETVRVYPVGTTTTSTVLEGLKLDVTRVFSS